MTKYFEGKLCTHMADVDFGKINYSLVTMISGFTFNQLTREIDSRQNARKERKNQELQEFIARSLRTLLNQNNDFS